MGRPTALDAGLRPDLAEAHAATVAAWAEPGTWWTGAERLAIVAESRRAIDADELPPWVAPSTVDGLIPDDHALPNDAVDAIWRITNHPGTLTAGWYASTVGGSVSPEAYVELVGLVASAACVDRFADALDLDRIPLPHPIAGEPSHERRPDAMVTTHWVPTAVDRGPMVLRALTAVPEADRLRHRLAEAQYLRGDALLKDLTWNRGTITRPQIELLATATSLANDCFY